uniref:Uncharacterized protein n=1 Tax=Peronospora matthiolae TaxID=2874970 RepID=A0AAV1TJG7_9STRA
MSPTHVELPCRSAPLAFRSSECNSEWTKGTWQTHSSASAMLLAHKRRKIVGNNNGSDKSEQDSLDMDEQLTEFVEINASDMDSLDMNPSQDFDGDEDCDTATQPSQWMQSCSWEDVIDVSQIQEEASEVFDNVIHAPRHTSIPSESSSSISCSPHERRAFTRPSYLTTIKVIPEANVDGSQPSGDDKRSLSDTFTVGEPAFIKPAGIPNSDVGLHSHSWPGGFDDAINRASTTRTATRPFATWSSGSDKSQSVTSEPQWVQRRSVKRDCSFIDNSNNYAVNGRQLLKSAPATSASMDELSCGRVIELTNGCFDLSDGLQAVSKVPCSISCFQSEPTAATSSSITGRSGWSMGFQPRLPRKKRRKAGQLTLDSFFPPTQSSAR